MKSSEPYRIAHMGNEEWEIGIFPVNFGYRVGAGRVNTVFYSINYCAGADLEFLFQLYLTVFVVVSSFLPGLEAYECERMMPSYEGRPINKDPCWPRLLHLAQEIGSPLDVKEAEDLIRYVRDDFQAYLEVEDVFVSMVESKQD